MLTTFRLWRLAWYWWVGCNFHISVINYHGKQRRTCIAASCGISKTCSNLWQLDMVSSCRLNKLWARKVEKMDFSSPQFWIQTTFRLWRLAWYWLVGCNFHISVINYHGKQWRTCIKREMERQEVPQAQPLLGENQRLALIYHSQIWWIVVDSTNFEQGKLRRWISVHCIYKCLQPLDFGGLHDIDGLAVNSIYQ